MDFFENSHTFSPMLYEFQDGFNEVVLPLKHVERCTQAHKEEQQKQVKCGEIIVSTVCAHQLSTTQKC